MLSPKVPASYTLALDTPPASGLVTLDEIKPYARVDFSDDDALLTALIQAATDHLDFRYGILGQALITQRWSVSVPLYNEYGEIHLPVPPVSSVVSIQYYDEDNASQTLTVSDFPLVKGDWWAYISPDVNVSWPGVYDRADAITVTFETGFGTADEVPQAIKQAVMMLVAHWSENREAVASGIDFANVPMAFDALIAPFKRLDV